MHNIKLNTTLSLDEILDVGLEVIVAREISDAMHEIDTEIKYITYSL